MSILVHLLLTVLILYCLITYTISGWAIFVPKQDVKLERAKDDILGGFYSKFFFWLLSPLVILDLFYAKVFGRSLL